MTAKFHMTIVCDTKDARDKLARFTYVMARLGGMSPMAALALAYGPKR